MQASNPTNLTSPYRRDIDGLRSIAVASVVFYHADLWFLPSGYVGVDIFFVISGFLIGGILNREIRGGTFSFARFYARRARRILPALLVVLLIFCALSMVLMGARELQQAGISAVTALFGISNIYFWWSTNYFAPSAHLNPFLMTWSLGVEEQFYVIFPFILILFSRHSEKWAAGAIALLSLLSFLLCVVATAYYPTAAFYLLPMRAWELGLGAMIALLWQHPLRPTSAVAHNVLGFAGLAAVLASCVVFTQSTPFPGIAATLPVLGSMALILSERSWVNRMLLSSSPMVGIGLVSYSWYLWHAPILALTRLTAFGNPSEALLCAMAVLSLGLAYLSWRYVEQPYRHAKLPDGATLRRFGIAMAVGAVLPILFVITRGLPQRLGPDALRIERALAAGRSNACLVSYGNITPSASPDCRPQHASDRPAAILLGDSHAAALGTAMTSLVNAEGIDFYQYEKSSCAPLLGATRAMPKYPQHAAECAAFNNAMFERVARDRTIKTVVLGGFWSGSFYGRGDDGQLIATDPGIKGNQAAILRVALMQTIRRYQAAGKKVILLGDVPLLTFDPGIETMGDALPVRRTLREWLGVPHDVTQGRAARQWVRPRTPADEIVKQIAQTIPGVTYFSPETRLCDAATCIYRRDLPYYIDFQHLSKFGGAYALRDLKFR